MEFMHRTSSSSSAGFVGVIDPALEGDDSCLNSGLNSSLNSVNSGFGHGKVNVDFQNSSVGNYGGGGDGGGMWRRRREGEVQSCQGEHTELCQWRLKPLLARDCFSAPKSFDEVEEEEEAAQLQRALLAGPS